MNLYEQHKAAFDKLAANGFTHISEAAKWFSKPRDFDVAIGFHNAVHHWIKGQPPSRTSDDRCRRWLELQRKPQTKQSIVGPAVQQVKPEGVILMVVASTANAERAKKMLALLGCEVEEI